METFTFTKLYHMSWFVYKHLSSSLDLSKLFAFDVNECMKVAD